MHTTTTLNGLNDRRATAPTQSINAFPVRNKTERTWTCDMKTISYRSKVEYDEQLHPLSSYANHIPLTSGLCGGTTGRHVALGGSGGTASASARCASTALLSDVAL